MGELNTLLGTSRYKSGKTSLYFAIFFAILAVAFGIASLATYWYRILSLLLLFPLLYETPEKLQDI